MIQFTWIAGLPFHMANGHLASFSADWGFLLDPLSSVMILVVTGIGFLIHVYSTGYMAHDNGYYRFFGYLNLFVFFMLMLVLANNYVLLFVGWEGVGLCSYLLIGFYFHKKSAGDAGKKAFVVNRVGDAGFVLGMLLMLSVLGTVRFTDVNALLRSGHFPAETAGFGVLSVMAVLMFFGATGKSAQIPLYVWLPDAMEGPTPVSALIHAATMVTAGVYMVARSAALFQLTPSASTRGRRWALSRRFSPPPSRWCRTISSACWRTPPSASSATCFWRSAWALTGWPSSTSSRTRSSRPCSSSAPAR